MTRSWQDALGVPHPPTDTVAAVPQTGLSPPTTASAFFGVVDRLPAAQASFLNAGPGEEVIPRLSLDPTGITQSVWVRYIVGSLGLLFSVVGLSFLRRAARRTLHTPERYVWVGSPNVQAVIDIATGVTLLAAAILLPAEGAFTVLIVVTVVTAAMGAWFRHRTRDRMPRSTDTLG